MAGTTFTNHIMSSSAPQSPHNNTLSSNSSTPYKPTPTRSVSASTSASTPTPARQNRVLAANIKANTALNTSVGESVSKPANMAVRTFSPVNANGCFEFDRVLKSANLQKRTRKTKSWKPIHLVLRPQSLAIYADSDGTKLRHHIQLADITAVARQRDPKRKERHVFALFSPERTYHIEAPTEAEAQSWVEMIRTQARIGAEEDEMLAMLSPAVEKKAGMDSGFFGRDAAALPHATAAATAHTAGETSASEMEASGTLPGGAVSAPITVRKNRGRSADALHSGGSSRVRKSSLGMQYLSGAEAASYSDFSDAGGAYPESTLSLPHQQASQAEREERARKLDEIYRPSTSATQGSGKPSGASASSSSRPPAGRRSVSGLSAHAGATQQGRPSEAAERVLYNGHLHLLKTRAGTRQWKSVWAVLRSTSLALYKNEEEYQPLHIVAFGSVVDAGDTDDLSRNRRHCFQVITDERQMKFCAGSEEEVVRWVGGFKALLAKRRERMVETAKTGGEGG